MKLTIKNILKKTDGNQELFTWIYDRTIELFNSTYLDNEQIKQTIENKIKNFDLNNYSKYLDKVSKELENSGEDRGKFSILFFDAINLLKFSYTYCFIEHNLTVINLLQQLAYLENSCADYNARKLTSYWIDVERTYNKTPRSTGGKIKAENQAKREAHIREQAIQMYRAQHPTLNRSWKSRNEFVSYFLGIENPKRNPNDLISDATVKRWIKESLNE